MTEEELEKEANKYAIYYPKVEKGEILTSKDLQEAYIAGSKAHLPQWHDLRKAPKNLPKERGRELYLLKSKVGGASFYDVCRWISDYKEWKNNVDIIAWCEIPEFKE